MGRRRIAALVAGLLTLALLLLLAGGGLAAKPKKKPKAKKPVPAKVLLARTKHIVVIYEENHSFDNLYGGWEGVNGRAQAPAANTTQVNQAGTPYTCLMQVDVNLVSPPRPASCTDTTTGASFSSAFTNAPFTIDSLIPATATTCPPTLQAFSFPNGVKDGAGLPGGCTRDLVHEFYQEQYQLNGGQQNRYATGSDAVGTTMGVYDTKALPVYRYLHAKGHPRYAVADRFFQAAFGGSFLNHQWLIAAATPTYPGAPDNLHTILDSNGMPVKYPLYNPTGTVRRGPITAACPAPLGLACGEFAVNTMQPTYQPSGLFGAKLIPQSAPTIGDRLSAKGVDWAWYSGGWSNANGDVNAPGWTNGAGPKCSDPDVDPGVGSYPRCPNNLFQYHHQPFNYYTAYAPGTAARTAHLRDEAEFLQLATGSSAKCGLKPVSFVKPLGQENEHPGYASEPNGSSHLVTLLRAIETGKCARDTMVVVAYDEFGGQWDHVPPPGKGTAGPSDQWGPGTRIPALVISPFLRAPFVVDHTSHDTTSILATIEHRWKVAPLGSRDAAVRDLSSVFTAKKAGR